MGPRAGHNRQAVDFQLSFNRTGEKEQRFCRRAFIARRWGKPCSRPTERESRRQTIRKVQGGGRRNPAPRRNIWPSISPTVPPVMIFACVKKIHRSRHAPGQPMVGAILSGDPEESLPRPAARLRTGYFDHGACIRCTAREIDAMLGVSAAEYAKPHFLIPMGYPKGTMGARPDRQSRPLQGHVSGKKNGGVRRESGALSKVGSARILQLTSPRFTARLRKFAGWISDRPGLTRKFLDPAGPAGRLGSVSRPSSIRPPSTSSPARATCAPASSESRSNLAPTAGLLISITQNDSFFFEQFGSRQSS